MELQDAPSSWFADPVLCTRFPLARVLGHSSALLPSAGCSFFKNHITRSEFRSPALGFQDPKHRFELSLLVALDWDPGNHQSCFLGTAPEWQVLSLPSALMKL